MTLPKVWDAIRLSRRWKVRIRCSNSRPQQARTCCGGHMILLWGAECKGRFTVKSSISMPVTTDWRSREPTNWKSSIRGCTDQQTFEQSTWIKQEISNIVFVISFHATTSVRLIRTSLGKVGHRSRHYACGALHDRNIIEISPGDDESN